MKPEPLFDFATASALLVDANPLTRKLLVAILSGFGFRQLYQCGDLSTAATVIDQASVDLLFVDPYPIEETCFDFMRHVRAESSWNANVPLLLTSANPHMRLIRAATKSGADFVIAKPFSSKVVFDRIVWVAQHDGRGGAHQAGKQTVSTTGSGVEVW
ncbi:MAG: response regulator [Bauldia sp.]